MKNKNLNQSLPEENFQQAPQSVPPTESLIQQAPLPPPPPITSSKPTTNMPAKLPSISSLLKESWQIYKVKMSTLLNLVIIPAIVMILVFLVFIPIAKSLPGWFLYIFLALISILGLFLQGWAAIAMIVVIKERQEKLKIAKVLKKALSKIIPFYWASFLISAVILGGFIPLIVPGLILGIALSLGQLVLIYKDEKGFDALFKSSALTKDFRWAIFGRYFGLGLLIFGFALILGIITSLFNSKAITNIAFNAFSFLLTPLVLAFNCLIYEKLSFIKSSLEIEQTKQKKGIYVFLVFWGIIAIITLSFSPFIFLKVKMNQLQKDLPSNIFQLSPPTTNQEETMNEILKKMMENPEFKKLQELQSQ